MAATNYQLPMSMNIHISSAFEGGSIHCVNAETPENIVLELKADPVGAERYWYYFRLAGGRDHKCHINIANAGDAFRLAERESTDIPGPWINYLACASYDRKSWFRVPTVFKDDQLKITFEPNQDVIYFASFPPYSYDRHANLITSVLGSPLASLEILGQTHEGRDIELLRIGETQQEKFACWICARQHPSETMAEWFVEGLLERLVDADDFLARKLLSKAIFYVVPCMNPDGAWHGRTRRNGGNVDLNREWVEPSKEKSPEVFFVQKKMCETNVDFFMDIHGDEELPYVFLGGPLEVPSLTETMRKNFRAFQAALETANPDYKRGYEYPGGPPPTADLRMAWNYIGEKFQCLSILVEQPFKDCEHALDLEKGWSPERSRKLGASSLVALNSVIDQLR